MRESPFRHFLIAFTFYRKREGIFIKMRRYICTCRKKAVPLHRNSKECTEKRFDSLAQQVEHNTFNVGVLGSSPKRITKRNQLSPLFF